MAIVRQLIRRQGACTLLVAGAVLVNGVLGGSGVAFPLVELALQLALVGFGVAWFWLVKPGAIRQVPVSAWFLAGALVLVPLAQLVPLPPQIWHHLAGRETTLRSLTLIGQENTWRALSLTPDLTLASLCSALPTGLLLVMSMTVPRSSRGWLFGAMAVVALLSLLAGAGQIGGGEGNAMRFYQPDSPFLQGFQNNRNSQADVLLIGMVALTTVLREMAFTGVLPNRRLLVLTLVGGGTIVMALGVVLTGSRSGMVLLLPTIAAQGLLLAPWLRFSTGWRGLVGALLGALGLIYWALRDNAMVDRAVSRFATQGEFRPEIWTDSLFAIRTYFPWGAGMGNFIPVFFLHERLEIVNERVANRAHNEVLELALEAGIFGLAIAAFVIIVLVAGAYRGLNSGSFRIKGQVLCASSALFLVGTHSLLDYPLRSMSLAGMAAVCAGVLLCPMGFGSKQDD
jgi:exopolysaccharide production protein ExoQ